MINFINKNGTNKSLTCSQPFHVIRLHSNYWTINYPYMLSRNEVKWMISLFVYVHLEGLFYNIPFFMNGLTKGHAGVYLATKCLTLKIRMKNHFQETKKRTITNIEPCIPLFFWIFLHTILENTNKCLYFTKYVYLYNSFFPANLLLPNKLPKSIKCHQNGVWSAVWKINIQSELKSNCLNLLPSTLMVVYFYLIAH